MKVSDTNEGKKKVFSAPIFLQLLTTNEVQLFGVGLRGDPRMTES